MCCLLPNMYVFLQYLKCIMIIILSYMSNIKLCLLEVVS